MEMEFGTVIIGAVVALVCAIPFIADYRSRNNNKKYLLQSLTNIAQQQNGVIQQYEFCGDFGIGLDETKNLVFFFKKKDKAQPIEQHLDLTEIQSCQVLKRTRNFKNGNSSYGPVERVDLSFIPKNSGRKATEFELYHDEVNIQLTGEIQFAEKWSQIINERLRNNR